MISLSIFLDKINASPVDSGLSGIILRSRNNFMCTDAEINFSKFFFLQNSSPGSSPHSKWQFKDFVDPPLQEFAERAVAV